MTYYVASPYKYMKIIYIAGDMYIFDLSKNQIKKLNLYLIECYARHLEEKRKTISFEEFNALTSNEIISYTGAAGGALPYSFTPTSIGAIIIAKYFDKEINLTDYGM